MTERRQCADCDLDYSDEDSHRLIHEATMSAAAQVNDPASGEIPQP